MIVKLEKMLTRSRVLLGLAVTVAFSALLLEFSHKSVQLTQKRLWTAQELVMYNGTDNRLPILLAILGDASRAFLSGNFTGYGLNDSLHGLSSVEMKSLVDWRDFYFKNYIFVGNLVGRYYNNQGKPTKYLKGVEAKAARGAQLLGKQKEEEDKMPSCNSRWSQQEGGEVWCNIGYPRLVQRPLEIALTGKMSRRCVCFKEEELGKPGIEVYKGCDYLSKVCPV